MHFDRLIEIYTMVYSILQFNNVTKTGAAILLDLLVTINFGCQHTCLDICDPAHLACTLERKLKRF